MRSRQAKLDALRGGLRYLEDGELRLVREALRERNRLLRNAPHLLGPVVINEIMYHPAGRNEESIELMNLASEPTRLHESKPADGDGPSLERRDPRRFGDDPDAWQAISAGGSPGRANTVPRHIWLPLLSNRR